MIDLKIIEQEIHDLKKKIGALEQLKRAYGTFETDATASVEKLDSLNIGEVFDLDIAKKTIREIFSQNGNQPMKKADIAFAISERHPNVEMEKIQEKMTYLALPKTEFFTKEGYGKYRLA